MAHKVAAKTFFGQYPAVGQIAEVDCGLARVNLDAIQKFLARSVSLRGSAWFRHGKTRPHLR
ncbi:MAG: hypothetical protein EA370_04510 [Wenzhouxiangella sp.]|nr:MAG: hypothetical protein EA370_04510 [Wenzhouxiangella sp.]